MENISDARKVPRAHGNIPATAITTISQQLSFVPCRTFLLHAVNLGNLCLDRDTSEKKLKCSKGARGEAAFCAGARSRRYFPKAN